MWETAPCQCKDLLRKGCYFGDSLSIEHVHKILYYRKYPTDMRYCLGIPYGELFFDEVRVQHPPLPQELLARACVI